MDITYMTRLFFFSSLFLFPVFSSSIAFCLLLSCFVPTDPCAGFEGRVRCAAGDGDR